VPVRIKAMLARIVVYLYLVTMGVAFLLERPMELAVAIAP
jgi:hypothetical protein